VLPAVAGREEYKGSKDSVGLLSVKSLCRYTKTRDHKKLKSRDCRVANFGTKKVEKGSAG